MRTRPLFHPLIHSGDDKKINFMSIIRFFQLENNDYSILSYDKLIEVIDEIIQNDIEVEQKIKENLQELKEFDLNRLKDDFNFKHIIKCLNSDIKSTFLISKLIQEYKRYLPNLKGKRVKKLYYARLKDIGENAKKLFYQLKDDIFDENKYLSKLRVAEPETRKFQTIIDNIYNQVLEKLSDLNEMRHLAKELEKYIDFSGDNNQIQNEEIKPIINLPKNADWEYLKIEFLEQYKVKIYYKKEFIKTFTYQELDFVDKRTENTSKKADKQWECLFKFSFKEGKLDLNHLVIEGKNEEEKTNIREKYRKQIEKLNKKLKIVFGVDAKPIKNIDEIVYSTKFILKPPPGIRGNGEPWQRKKYLPS